jgi:CheY-like chemotaxis protein
MATVLIVDDDKHTRALLERIFHNDARIARHQLKVVQAGDGIEGLKVFDAEQPDVVITDLLMPRMDGFKFCRELRARAQRRPVGLLVLSGVYRDVSISSRLREEFNAAFYTKPYQIKDLVLALEKQLLRLAPDTAQAARVEAIPDSPLPVAEARRGKLEDHPLPRLLVDLHEDRATGVLELRRGRIEKRIDLVVGHPVAVTSNQRGEMLGHFLVLRGVISEKIHQQALERAHDEEKKLGEALMEMGRLTSADLVKHLTAQARYKITRALRWPDGSWSYRPNRELLDSAAKGNALDPVAVVFLGLRKTATPETSTDAVAALEGRRVTLTPRGEKVRHTIERVFGTPFVEALLAMPPVENLLGAPFDAAQTMPALEALIVTGCVTGFGAPVRAEPPAREEPDLEELSGSFLLPEAPTAQTGRPAGLAGGQAPHAYDEIFADESSDVGAPVPAEPSGDDAAEVLDLLPPPEAVPEEIPLAESALYDVEAQLDGPVITMDAEPAPEAEVLREQLLGEYLRLQGKDLYAILDVPRAAEPAHIAAAFAERMAAVSLERYERYDMGPDYGKLEEIHAAYRRAHEVLSAPDRRAGYDRELSRLDRAVDGATLAAELAFRAGERRMALEHHADAAWHLRLAVDSAPDVADYQAALGWALHRAGGDAAAAAPEHLAQALAIDPDHGAAHEFLGRLLIAEGRDPAAAADHLEKALDAQPARLGALAPLEELRLARGEPRLLEKRYRGMLRRARPGDVELAVRLWRGLARTYLALRDEAAARTAFACAHRLAPDDPGNLDALAELAPTPREREGYLRARWRLEPQSARPGLAMIAAAEGAGRFDVAFLAAAALVARGLAADGAAALYRRHRPRFLTRAQGTFDAELHARVRHPDDDAELGAVFALLDPAAQRHAPLEAGELGVAPEDLVADELLPEPVRKVRDYAAHVLGVAPARVARRRDFGLEAHLGALAQPVLLVGPELLSSTDRVALAFHLGRALSFLAPGRAFAASRPARVLKELFIAAVLLEGTPVAPENPERIAQAAQAVATLPIEDLARLARLAGAIAQQRSSLNFSSYNRALSRTADRLGLVLCGDPAVAAAAVSGMGGDDTDLLDWAISGEHQDVRATLGLSIDV